MFIVAINALYHSFNESIVLLESGEETMEITLDCGKGYFRFFFIAENWDKVQGKDRWKILGDFYYSIACGGMENDV